MSILRHDRGYVANKAGGFVAGLLMGGLIGSGAMLLLAPASGKKTRAKIQQEGVELSNQVVETVEDAVAQARGKARRVANRVRKETKKLEQRGYHALDGQTEIVDGVVDAEKKAVRKVSKEARRLKKSGQEMVDAQKKVVSDVVEAEQAALHDLANG